MTVNIITGNALEVLRTLPSAYFDCCMTSPPYWGLRDNGVSGQFGLERTLGEHLDVMIAVFREVRRVLKAQGVVFLNYGDCYATAPNGKSAADYKAEGSDDRDHRDKPFSTIGPIYEPVGRPNPSDRSGRIGGLENGRGGNGPRHQGLAGGRVVAGGTLKNKDLCMIANRLAIALQDDGWYVRSEIVWVKPNPMPESIYDRPTNAHEKVWLLSKSEDYFYDHAAIREPCSPNTHARVSQKNFAAQLGSTRAYGGKADRPMKPVLRTPSNWDTELGHHHGRERARSSRHSLPDGIPTSDHSGGISPRTAPGDEALVKANERFHRSTTALVDDRNARNVWTIASTPLDGEYCLACRSYFAGKAKRALRVETVKSGKREERRRYCTCGCHDRWLSHFSTFPPRLAERCLRAGVPLTTCHLCGEAQTAKDCGGICANLARDPGRVLDPFGGAGTVGLVAQRLGLDATLIELNPDYAAMARCRIAADAPPPVYAEAAE
jgi:DNA modification methylase